MLIGIGGVSQAGKSSLAKQLMTHFQNVRVFSQDDFVKPANEIPKIRDRTDWELPESIDHHRLANEVEKALESEPLIIVEGLFAFNFQSLNRLYHKCLLVEIDEPTFLERRKKEIRWGEEPLWFIQHVWGSYLKHFDRPKRDHLTVSGMVPFDLDKIVAYIKD